MIPEIWPRTNSSANIFACCEICDFGGMINEIMLVPLPRLKPQSQPICP